MSDVLKELSNLPTWIAAPVILTTLFVTLWPKILQILSDLNAGNRAYQHEKRRLELLKLRYEIEVVKKAHGLEGLEELLPSEALERRPQAEPATVKPPADEARTELSVWRRFAYGALGALIPIFLKLTVMLIEGFYSDFSIQVMAAGSGSVILVFCVLGGIGAALVPRSRATPVLCFMIGLSVVLLILVVGTSLPQEPTSYPPIEGS